MKGRLASAERVACRCSVPRVGLSPLAVSPRAAHGLAPYAPSSHPRSGVEGLDPRSNVRREARRVRELSFVRTSRLAAREIVCKTSAEELEGAAGKPAEPEHFIW
jgi:hypothetical protein